MNIEKVNRIKVILEQLPTTKLEGLKKLFWEELNYDVDNTPLSQASWPDDFNELFESTPVSFATYASNNEFHVIYIQLKGGKLLIGVERRIVNTLIKDYPYSLFVFSNEYQNHWHFVNAISDQEKKNAKQRILRRISVSADDRLRTASERVTCLDTAEVVRDLFGVSPITIQQQHDQAFNVEAVTEEFFNEYKAIFTLLTIALLQQAKDSFWAHDFALQFMNRLMFIYYIERKRWLGDNPDFLHGFWREYLKTQRGTDTFVDEWLNILFFEAFNDKFSAGRSDIAYLPEVYRKALQFAPYLNGGLFSKNELDDKYPYLIKDSLMGAIFDFLDKYNFTISEDTPLDQEVAVDPEMIGKVYESLVNVSAEADEQSDAGIFYTPRIEIDLMCRLSLVDWLANQMPEAPKNAFYELVFAFSPDEKKYADKQISELTLWPQLDHLLNGITVLDPACGSGSFLVGMLGILDDLLIRSSKQLDRDETPYERRKRIIGNSLYGVDIMEWAVHVAELRLWLQLVIETDLDLGERRSHPLLPNLSFKIRHGDSLVQEIGGINFSLHRQGGFMKAGTTRKLENLKTEKYKFFQNDPTCKYHSKAQVEQDEYLLFKQIIDDQIETTQNKITEINNVLAPKKNLFGEVQTIHSGIEIDFKSQELTTLVESMVSLESAKLTIKNEKAVPFVWDVAFVEIFEGEKSGFDIVIGNPPYTRQEKIRNLALAPELVTKDNKKEYKEKLAKAVYHAWPNTFGYNQATGAVSWSLDKKSDLYIYFYLISLSLINPKGSFCFITSNAWLDVGYGADLQYFLLTRSKVKMIVDNQVKRSFKSADINTIIILLSKPEDKKNDLLTSLQHDAHFVMFKVSFEEGLSPVLWEEIEEVKEKKVTNEYNILVKRQETLVDAGLDEESGKYAGDKWGGKYLRAPDIYWYIMEKCKDKLVRLDNISNLRRGITTGANEFFYLDEEKIRHWGIEEEFLLPVLTSTRYLNSYCIKKENSDKFVFNCQKNKKALINTNALQYIKFGEEQEFNKRPSCRNRSSWYSINNQDPADFIMMRFRDSRNWTPIINEPTFYIGDTVFIGSYNYQIPTKLTNCLLNSSFQILISELYGRSNLGEGLLTTYGPEIRNFIIFSPIFFEKFSSEVITQFEPILRRSVYSVFDEFKNEDRKHFDQLLFRCLQIEENLVDDLYYETIKLINNRQNRANT